MKVKINEEKCIGCGLCPALAPEVFTMKYDQGKAVVENQPSELTDEVQSAADSCPVKAIEISQNE